MVPVASVPRVVIAGGGPGGLAAASLLREAGALVTVLERALPGAMEDSARAGLVVNRSGWEVLRRVGGGALLDDARMSISATEQLMSRRAIVDAVAGHAESLGAEVRRGVQVGAITDGPTGVSVAIRDARTGVEELLDADWFIDASGGHTQLAQEAAFTRRPAQGPLGLLPQERTFVAVAADAAPGDALGWQAADGTFAISNPAEGVVVAYRGGDPLPAGSSVDAMGDELLRSVGVDPATRRGEAFVFTARQQLADHAADGHRLLVGDSVGTVMPATQMGTTLALLDAERAARTILAAHGAPAADAVRAVAAFDAETVTMHRAFIR